VLPLGTVNTVSQRGSSLGVRRRLVVTLGMPALIYRRYSERMVSTDLNAAPSRVQRAQPHRPSAVLDRNCASICVHDPAVSLRDRQVWIDRGGAG